MGIGTPGTVRRAISAIVLLLIAPIAQGVYAIERTKEASWHAVDVWRQPQGLPQNQVLSLLQARDGYIWIGTSAGVSRFDGVRFTTFDDRDKNQLRENEVWALAEGDDASLWIGTDGGLSQLKNGCFTNYTVKDGLAYNVVRGSTPSPLRGPCPVRRCRPSSVTENRLCG